MTLPEWQGRRPGGRPHKESSFCTRFLPSVPFRPRLPCESKGCLGHLTGGGSWFRHPSEAGQQQWWGGILHNQLCGHRRHCPLPKDSATSLGQGFIWSTAHQDQTWALWDRVSSPMKDRCFLQDGECCSASCLCPCPVARASPADMAPHWQLPLSMGGKDGGDQGLWVKLPHAKASEAGWLPLQLGGSSQESTHTRTMGVAFLPPNMLPSSYGPHNCLLVHTEGPRSGPWHAYLMISGVL